MHKILEFDFGNSGPSVESRGSTPISVVEVECMSFRYIGPPPRHFSRLEATFGAFLGNNYSDLIFLLIVLRVVFFHIIVQ